MRTKFRPVARAIDPAKRGLAHAGRADQAKNRPLDLAHALLHREVLEDPLLDPVQAVVVGLQHLVGVLDVLLDLGALLPGDRQHPVEIVAHHRGLGRHRAHSAQLLELGHGLLAGFLAELGLVDLLFQLGQFVSAVRSFAQLLLDRLELFAQIVFALGLPHLALDPVADPLLDLEHVDLALHEGVDYLPACSGRRAG
jgi:hypothetical protein